MRIRSLTAADCAPYRDLMLEAYEKAAGAFTSTAEERAQEPLAWWLKRIDDPTGLGVAFGTEEQDQLVGAVALEYSQRPKTRHTAMLIGMYVRDQARANGAGMALVQVALEHARARAEVQVVTLTVTEGNETALNLYRRAGFQAWGTQPIAVATPSGYRGKIHMCCFLTRRADGAGACEAQSVNTSRACQ